MAPAPHVRAGRGMDEASVAMLWKTFPGAREWREGTGEGGSGPRIRQAVLLRLENSMVGLSPERGWLKSSHSESPESTLGASYTRSSYSYHHLSQFNLDITPIGRDRYHFTDAARRGGVT